MGPSIVDGETGRAHASPVAHLASMGPSMSVDGEAGQAIAGVAE